MGVTQLMIHNNNMQMCLCVHLIVGIFSEKNSSLFVVVVSAQQMLSCANCTW